MSENPFQITAIKRGSTAEIRIIGIIGWENDSETFRSQVDALMKDGVEDAHLYIQSAGGNCFDADEIVNIISKFTGEVTGEGGSLVASAATYIALHCKTFSMPENGMFMVHKPSGAVVGSTADIESYLKLMRDCETKYYDAYKAVARNLTTLDEKWNSSADWWMTAAEAKEQGFVTEITHKVRIDRQMQAVIAACGCPFKTVIDHNLNNESLMNVKSTALLLGLPETATEAEIQAKIQNNAQAAARLERLQKEIAEKEKAEKNAKINAALDKAIADKRIKADCRAEWEKMLCDNFDTANKVLESIAPVEKLSSQIATSTEGKKTYKGKTFAQLQDENPEALAELETENPEAFAELFNKTFKTKQ